MAAAVPEDPAEPLLVDAGASPSKTRSRALYTLPCVATPAWGFRKRLQSIGVSESETKPETRIATPIVTANSRKSRPTIPPMKRTGMKTAASEIVIERIVKPISFEPARAASRTPWPSSMCRTMFSSMTMASSTTKPTESVRAMSERLSMRVAEEVHDRERPRDRERQGEARDHGRRDVPQEEEDHEDDEHERQEERELHVRHRLADRLGAVEEDVEPRRGGELRPEGGQELLHLLDDLDRVRPGLLLDRQDDGVAGR